MLLALRPKQYSKNVLLFAAPFAAGTTNGNSLNVVFWGFSAYSLASSIGYVINDMNDVELDLQHPIKKYRPFASGKLSSLYGYLIVIILSILLLAILTFLSLKFTLVLIIYMLITLLYTKLAKNLPVVEIFIVASGFVLRLIAGAVLLDIHISEWFLIVGGFGAVYIVSIKRIVEKRLQSNHEVRSVVKEYKKDFLESIAVASQSVCVTSFCFWAFTQTANPFWFQLSIIPFVISLFRYRWSADRNNSDAPEDLILNDKVFLALVFTTMLLLSIGIY
jgi:decaprenyl-phosphate phosphoribosyltransferase